MHKIGWDPYSPTHKHKGYFVGWQYFWLNNRIGPKYHLWRPDGVEPFDSADTLEEAHVVIENDLKQRPLRAGWPRAVASG